MFSSSFAEFDSDELKYRLFLASAGSSTIDRWVEYDIKTGRWWGPHRTSAFAPRCAFTLFNANDQKVFVTGSTEAYLWQPSSTRTDHTSTGIAVDVVTRWIGNEEPDYEKVFGHLSVHGKVQSAGTSTITPYVGYLDAIAGSAISYTMTLGRQRLRRLGQGKLFKLNFTHSTAAQPVEIYNFEVPTVIRGKR